MPGKLDGKVALVTGAASGIGRATAIAFSSEGAQVVLADKAEEKLRVVGEEIKAAGGQVAVVVCDATKEVDCKAMVDTAMDAFGGLHVAFNNHGIMAGGRFQDATEEQISAVLDTNLKSLVFCFKYQIPAMAKTGKTGSIIVNTSAAGSRVTAVSAERHVGLYAASKAGANMLMKYAAIEGAASGVRVNAVAPGLTETPALRPAGVPPEAIEGLRSSFHLIDRFILPQEIATLVILLASDDCAMVTGSVYSMDAGFAVKA